MFLSILNNILNSISVAVDCDDAGICLAVGDNEYQFLNFDFAIDNIHSLIKQIFESDKIEKVVYDAKALMHVLKFYNIQLNNFYDVSLAYYLIGISDKELALKKLTESNNLPEGFSAVNLLKFKDLSLNKLNEISYRIDKLYLKLDLPPRTNSSLSFYLYNKKKNNR